MFGAIVRYIITVLNKKQPTIINDVAISHAKNESFTLTQNIRTHV